MESVKAAATGDELVTLFLEALPDCPIGKLRMLVSLGISNALVEQPGVQLLIALYP